MTIETLAAAKLQALLDQCEPLNDVLREAGLYEDVLRAPWAALDAIGPSICEAAASGADLPDERLVLAAVIAALDLRTSYYALVIWGQFRQLQRDRASKGVC